MNNGTLTVESILDVPSTTSFFSLCSSNQYYLIHGLSWSENHRKFHLYFLLNRLEHIDELLRSARLSGYLYIRTVFTFPLSSFNTLNVHCNFCSVVLRQMVFLSSRDGKPYQENLLLSMIPMSTIGYHALLSYMESVYISTYHLQVFQPPGR